MIKTKFKVMLAVALSASFMASPLLTSGAKAAENQTENRDRFLELRDMISDSNNGYYRTIEKDGKTYKIPYHCVETFLCEGPDYGHETTSETYSYYVWLEAMYGKFSGDWTAFNDAWDSLEKFMIPSKEDQPTNKYYDPSDPADYSDEFISTSKYPSPSNSNAKVGSETLTKELKSAYGTDEVYGMHWLLDTDNWYGYGKHGKDGAAGYDKSSKDPVFINTYQRGPKESAFKTVTHPSWDDCKTYGDQSKTGFLGLFNGSDAHQWRYTIASDADARAIQATYWADEWAKEKGQVSKSVSKATKLGDYLRYSMYDKYFRAIGCENNAYASGDNKHYLLGWYYSWGGDTDVESWGSWAWKIGCSHNHFGYQNPMAAWILSNDNSSDKTSDFTSKTSSGKSDWKKSLDRQVELYQWLQSDEGAIAGGCTNSYTTDSGSYQQYPNGAATFYGMIYDEAPVYLDPPSNNWFGMQVWSLQRLAEYYYKTGDKRAESVLNKWANWAINNTEFTSSGYKMPASLDWKGQPGKWNESTKSSDNSGLHVEIAAKTDADIGVAGSYANTLFWTSAANTKWNGDASAAAKQKDAGKQLIDIMWNSYKDDKGIAHPEEIDPAKYFDSEIFVPSNYNGKMGNGDTVKSGVKFIDIRSGYKNDSDYTKVKAAYDAGQKLDMTYHRYWAQVDAALAYGTYSLLFENPDPNGTGTVITGGKLGDVNDDKKVDINDYTLLKKYVNTDASIKLANIKNADVNKDGNVDFLDLLALKALI